MVSWSHNLGKWCVIYPALELLLWTWAIFKTLRGIIKKEQVLFHSASNHQLSDSGNFFFFFFNKTLASGGTCILLHALWGKILRDYFINICWQLWDIGSERSDCAGTDETPNYLWIYLSDCRSDLMKWLKTVSGLKQMKISMKMWICFVNLRIRFVANKKVSWTSCLFAYFNIMLILIC